MTDFPHLRLEGTDLCLTRHGQTIIDKVSLRIGEAGICGLVGANGSGKTTLISLMAGLIRPDSGKVHITGMGGMTPSALRIGLMMQKPVIMRRSVYGNCDYVLAAQGIPAAERKARIADGLALVKLDHLKDQDARTLSSGEQQRMALARVLIAGPGILLCDEATSNLDPQSTRMIEAIVKSRAKAGLPVLWVTHHLAQLRRLANRVVFMQHGRVLTEQDVSAFFDAPATKEAREYIDFERI
jgi:tungstate transport system ATP-binding protein